MDKQLKVEKLKVSWTHLIQHPEPTIDSILTNGIMVWHRSCTPAELKDQHRMVKTSQCVVGLQLPHLEDVYNTRLREKTASFQTCHTPVTLYLNFCHQTNDTDLHNHTQTEEQLFSQRCSLHHLSLNTHTLQ